MLKGTSINALVNANNVSSLEEGLYYHRGSAQPKDLTNYPTISDYSTAGSFASYNLLSFVQQNRIVQWCIITYFTTAQDWARAKRFTRVMINSTWLGWTTF